MNNLKGSKYDWFYSPKNSRSRAMLTHSIRGRTALFISALLLSVNSFADTDEAKKIQYGLGIGSLYNGMGVNASFVDKSYRYLSLGCFSVARSSDNNYKSNCGIGLGIMSSTIFDFGENHLFGTHFGVTNNTYYNSTEIIFGIPYIYFPSGYKNGGLNLGLMPYVKDKKNDDKSGILLSVGYQFKR